MTATHEIALPFDGAADMTTGSVLFIGTATVLIRCAGFSILTDPAIGPYQNDKFWRREFEGPWGARTDLSHPDSSKVVVRKGFRF